MIIITFVSMKTHSENTLSYQITCLLKSIFVRENGQKIISDEDVFNFTEIMNTKIKKNVLFEMLLNKPHKSSLDMKHMLELFTAIKKFQQ
jgi:hypothetical protein